MQKTTFDRILGFLHGASLAFVIIGTFMTFKLFLFLGVINSLLVSFVFLFISLVVMLLIDSFRVRRMHLEEIKKQTKILQTIEKRLDDKKLLDN
ncbi:hypothetical protein [Sulfurimonas sp. HSL-1716]|uniref:hypothetical protein n=1 Tax=Hydrocurvibacter sulfurireducens TaxID=3131937 RepID=UPI0031F7B735